MPWNVFQSLSLKTKVTIFTLVVFLIGVWSMAFYANRTLREDMQRLLGEQQFATVSILAAEINEDLGDRLRALQTVAGGLDPALLGSKTASQAYLEQREAFLRLFNGGSFVTGLDGTATASIPTSAERIGVNYMERDVIVSALKEGKATIGRPVMGKKLVAPILVMAVPIRDARDKVIGALAGVTDLSKPNFLDRITQGRYGSTGSYLLADPQRRLIVTASDKSRIMEVLPAPGVNPSIDRLLQGYEGSSLLVNAHGVEVLLSSKRISLAGWDIVASLPAAEAFAPIRAMQQRMLLATIFLTLLAGGLTWWMTWRMLRHQLAPMLAATKALSTLSDSGQSPRPLPVTSQDEIGELIGGFNSLLDTVQQREAVLRQILDTSSVAIFLVDMEGRITHANQRMAEMFGCPLGALLGQEYVALIHPAEREIGHQKMLALLASALPSVDLDRLYWRADHTEFWGHLTGRRFHGASGEERGLIGVIADISERKSIEERLRRQNDVLSAIIENFPGAISVFDADLRLATHNNQFKQLMGLPDSLFAKPELHFEDVIRYNAERGEYGPGDIEQQIAAIVARARNFQPHKIERVRPNGLALEIRGMPLPEGGFVTTYIDITERKQMEDQVRQLAFYDPLTQLPNRRLLDDRLRQTMAASRRSGCYSALMFLDLDNFKPLNDLHGHVVGDLLLVEVADRLRTCVREMDTVARFGGDEFVVMLSDLNADSSESAAQAEVVAEKIRIRLAEPYLLTIKREGEAESAVEHRCTASIGVALFIDHDVSPDDILKWADAAMYRAKEAGRNSIRFFDSTT